MKQKFIENDSPIAAPSRKGGAKAVIGGTLDMYGACSIETFSSASPLGLTHEDAQGWLDFVTQFTPGNFWYRDSGVQLWLYQETYANWQDTYGADAVIAFYHSGHGVMDNNGVYQAPLGAKWNNRDWAFSTDMNLGKETARYLFWSTCFSLRIFAPHDPIRTWHPVNKGFRMLFGYETTSVDDANYGKFFWEEWKKGKPFSTAWLDASWRISHNQVPSVMATGVTAAEASQRLFNEKEFFAAPGSNAFYNWRWYNAAKAVVTPMSAKKAAVPKKPLIAILAPDTGLEKEAAKVANALGLTKNAADTILYDKDGVAYIKDRSKKLTITREGHINMETGKHNYKNTDLLAETKAISIAEGVVAECGFDKKADLQLERVLHGCSCAGTSKGSGKIDEPVINETVIQFRQIIDGLPAINSGNGEIRVSLDNDGNVIKVVDTTKKVIELTPKAKGTLAPSPGHKDKAIKTFGAPSRDDIEHLFKEKLDKITGRGQNGAFKAAGKTTEDNIIEDKIGYNLNGGYGSVVAHREYEVDFGKGIKKRYKVRVPIFV